MDRVAAGGLQAGKPPACIAPKYTCGFALEARARFPQVYLRCQDPLFHLKQICGTF